MLFIYLNDRMIEKDRCSLLGECFAKWLQTGSWCSPYQGGGEKGAAPCREGGACLCILSPLESAGERAVALSAWGA